MLTPGEDRNYNTIWCLLAVLVFAPMRSKFRYALGAPDPSISTGICDGLVWGCCSCCAVVQEAREIDRAQGVSYKCPCTLEAKGAPVNANEESLVGEPVQNLGRN
eukprot:gnl/MRDRNA2_/MRDRNA2_249528_c0_seq1.p2 gnl/MRDRNA2_/MRDRNA2_249528_c0~~gnl/MRDRNA2_/MRDRNA2_249528_c0_seq1.p2  ORF type:complete len:121 (+),score=21.06 gnl/MRDRNA2_/MRDRNA2_249528_c0_seq1:49-363(+)